MRLSPDQKVGLYITVSVHLAVIIVLLAVRIGYEVKRENSFVLDFSQQEEKERQEQVAELQEKAAEDLERLGFSPKQAQAILHYREAGGRFRRKADFAKSFVVSEELYAALEPWIEIPKVDLNRADSAALDALPGIGPYYVRKILEYRERLRGYSYPEELMDIERFDSTRFAGLADLVEAGPAEPYPLWTLPEDSLQRHPYIGSYAAHGVVLFRDHTPRSGWNVAALDAAGILKPGMGEKLARCRIAAPSGSGDDAPAPPAAR